MPRDDNDKDERCRGHAPMKTMNDGDNLNKGGPGYNEKKTMEENDNKDRDDMDDEDEGEYRFNGDGEIDLQGGIHITV